ncbi:MAG TPA: hypothetical protein PKD86_03115 [Gemmatales bacterium]|nr:hypothetical protein [Gemmatales bacterium]HMP58323.1 hypothetical protein [Gemmatales bacterium]
MDQPEPESHEQPTLDRSARRAEAEARWATVRYRWKIAWLVLIPLLIGCAVLAFNFEHDVLWVILIGSVLLFVALILFHFFHLKRLQRAAEMLDAADLLDFDFTEVVSAKDFKEAHGSCSLLEEGHSHKFHNVLVGQVGETTVCLADWSYTVGGGKSARHYAQTLVVLPGNPGWPDFRLTPENWLHRLGDWFGAADIDFDDSPQFSKMYLLKGPDEAAIRAVFAADVRSRLEEKANWHIEGHEAGLVAFRKNHQVAPDQLAEFIAEVLGLAALMAAPPPSPGS